MGLQPQKFAAGLATMPLMPVAGASVIGPEQPPATPSRADAIRAAKARIVRRKSLQKQRDAQRERQ